ncbi:DUF1003 domain-containing protein [Agrobacterium tumefaciens]|uniref:DUF1003 domain-containing protein n=1 Tax=Agrobacterium tumefaciens TaxID=358 RepID=UPI0015737A8B|nr:DUF1003 domain-containing protein [Agrobacterium tumefaciens]WCK68794.1 DUF1003 domain-containing protein [Agrobacterium tumefaciens]
MADYLRRHHPSLKPNDTIDRRRIEDLRRQSILDLLREDRDELTPIENEVAESIWSRETLAENTETEFDDSETLGSRVADLVAEFGGSWTFIIGFGSVLAAWMAYNSFVSARDAFDNYPFVLLNLVLSTIAAFQAPVIMMSQRRQEAKDRLRSTNDYKVNLKAELEIRRLHEKLDHLITRQRRSVDDAEQHALVTGAGKKELLRRSKQPRPKGGRQRAAIARRSSSFPPGVPAR